MAEPLHIGKFLYQALAGELLTAWSELSESERARWTRAAMDTVKAYMSYNRTDGEQFSVRSIFTRSNGAMVELSLDHSPAQITPDVAREIAHNILAATEAAHAEAFIMKWLQAKVRVSESESATLLGEFREYKRELALSD